MASQASSDKKIACNICRRRKTGCDRAKPKCNFCRKNGFQCEYTSSERHPGLRAGYVAQLEKKIANLEGRLSSVEEGLHRGFSIPLTSHGQDPSAFDHSTDPAFLNSPARNAPNGALNTFQQSLASVDNSTEISNSIIAGQDLNGDTAAPKRHLLSFPIVTELCSLWFKKYHSWFPILHQPSLTEFLHTQEHQTGEIELSLVIKAIVTITLPHSDLWILSAEECKTAQEELGSTIVLAALRTPTLDSVQALLILSVLQYGEGNCHEASVLLAMSRRIGERISIAEAPTDPSRNGHAATSPSALRRLPQFVNTIVGQEQKIRSHWMIEMLDSISTIGGPYNGHLAKTPGNPPLPCSDSFWAFPEPLLSESTLRPYHYCSALSLCVVLATTELSRVHSFHLNTAEMSVFEERDAWQSEAQRIDERLTNWRDEFVAAVYRLINAEYPRHDRPEMDPYIVLTNCVLNAAVITLLQKRAPCPEGIVQTVDPWAFASNRCVYASENTAFKVRQMEEEELLVCHPHLIFSIFVAARFYLVHSKAMDANVPTNLHSLAFALHTCGKRWPLARMFEKIIRIAVAEYRTPIVMSTVPRVFYDLRHSTFEIADSLIEWAKSPSCQLPAADGPYFIDS